MNMKQTYGDFGGVSCKTLVNKIVKCFTIDLQLEKMSKISSEYYCCIFVRFETIGSHII